MLELLALHCLYWYYRICGFFKSNKFVWSWLLAIVSTLSYFPKEQSQNIAILLLLLLITIIMKSVATIYEVPIMYKGLLGAL